MPPKYAAKVDANQGELVKHLIGLGVSVFDTSNVHGGFPDVTLGYLGLTVLAEIKNNKVKKKKDITEKLTPQQVKFHDEFKGAKVILETVEQCTELFLRMREVSLIIGGSGAFDLSKPLKRVNYAT